MKFLIRLLVIILLFSVPMGVLIGVLRKTDRSVPMQIDLKEEYRESILDQVRDPFSQFNRDELAYYSKASPKLEAIKKQTLITPQVDIMSKDSKKVISSNKKNQVAAVEKRNSSPVQDYPIEGVDVPKKLDDGAYIPYEREKKTGSVPPPQKTMPPNEVYTVNSITSTDATVAESKKKGFWSSVKSFFSGKNKKKNGQVNDGSDELYSNVADSKDFTDIAPSPVAPVETPEDSLPSSSSIGEIDENERQTGPNKSKSDQIELPSLDFLADDILKLDK